MAMGGVSQGRHEAGRAQARSCPGLRQLRRLREWSVLHHRRRSCRVLSALVSKSLDWRIGWAILSE